MHERRCVRDLNNTKEYAVHLQSHATPTQESPEQRRAALHRALERGLESDELWRELAEVNLELGHDDQAVRCVRRIDSPTVRKALESQLQRRGLITATQDRVHTRNHRAAPAASEAGTSGADTATAEPRRPQPREADGETASLQEHLADSVQFLFLQHMPWLCLLTTLAFPLIVGLGGFLTAGGSPLGLAAIAAVPGICVLAVVGAMGRRILVGSQDGIGDVPELGALRPLFGDARRFLGDALCVTVALLLPSLIALQLQTPLLAVAPGLLVSVFVAPLAWGLRQVRGDLGSLSPVTLVRGVARGGRSYVGLCVLCWAMFVPAAFAAWAVSGKALWVQIAAIGPLVVLPLFATSRLIGTWLDARRDQLAVLLEPSRARAVRTAARQAGPPAPAAPEPVRARLPEALRHLAPPAAQRRQADAPGTPVRKVAKGKKAAAVRPVAAAGPEQQAPAAARPHRDAAAVEPRAIEGRGPRRAAVTDSPDLSNMPGAMVVSGQERVRHGAAARTQ